ncbi:MAG: YggS family pyridoxal phosphate-dependent enzyme [Herminiimonas sp.]|nr:YggS family pyridoxal phosphate-dependent enzyme [Herminiimonas sp.]
MSRIADNLQGVHVRIAEAATKVSRPPQAILLLAASKTFGAAAVLEAIAAGQRDFGENYLQEAVDKIEEVRGLQNNGACSDAIRTALLNWHFIGPIQSNKTKPLAEHFDWVHSVDRGKIATRLSQQRPSHLAPLNVCIQVNISNEDTKSGVQPEAVPALARCIAAMPGLRLRGLMAIPQAADDVARQRLPFRALHALYTALQADGMPLDTLSIGMSADLEAAIYEGATIVRVGSAIFGQR